MQIPKMAKGTVIPTSVYVKEMNEAKAKAERKTQFRHDWAIAIFSLIGGGIMGVITSLVTLYIKGLL